MTKPGHSYTALLYLINQQSQQPQKTVLFQDASFADLEYRLHQIKIKKQQCIICPKSYDTDEKICVDITI